MKIILIAIMSALLLMSAPMAASAHGALSEMVTIIIHLNHYPTADDKKVLADIAADPQATAGDKIIAGALMRMQHRVEGADAVALRKLAADDATPAAEKELATILLGITHHPSAGDIAHLKTLAE
ncbi:MAG: hypothetical protein COW18_02385 [Zetaproteobacteria bacterium CG12_big_fil_rev_8_21_14_0_65_54_13]|nr:MAG: hypothetical protein COX55_10285 [Zetaproteobacteria bacterium CG23_combo_of_CG06-09_8_20_14_all_54_7]PIW51144.1 MAG: hypothetical protein COW18_02385 [Zetaproteobacteria bacterium CG12_big_fil_rev_8_21_14_0_65_54_13]PIX55722.1 MAG: hypothetical protein COZ50_01295 [Zetaproteobacteria bacterium CG_4_10_14_3_um_filter_54_28]PJA29398.1 MAG: hypothetical protein CO188_06645 [Zetaproteobacteria bacterium CG_4_9_14_3_um_filter_54_145]